MFENDSQNMENMLLVLYTLNELNMPVTGLYLDEIMLKPGFMNYFSLRLAISELVKQKAVNEDPDTGGVTMYSLTDRGKELLDSMDHIMQKGRVAAYNTFIKENRENVKKETETGSCVFTSPDGHYYVRCFIRKGRTCTVDIKIPVTNKEEGSEIVKNWKENTGLAFLKVYDSLLPQKKQEKEQ